MKKVQLYKLSLIILCSPFIFLYSRNSMPLDAKIYVAGHRGLVGSAIVRTLHGKGYANVITRASQELDLRKQHDVEQFFQQEKPEYVFLAAAKVGGILANKEKPFDFLYDNLLIDLNTIKSSLDTKVKKIIYISSVTIYPSFTADVTQDKIMTDYIPEFHRGYIASKMVGTLLCQLAQKQSDTKCIQVIPTSIYGPFFNVNTRHVIPSLIKRFHNAKIKNYESVEVWGTGNVMRQFIYSEDVAHACLLLMNNCKESKIVPIGPGEEVSIKKLVQTIKKIVGFDGNIVFDISKPDGAPRKKIGSDYLRSLGWKNTNLENGLKRTVEWYFKKIGL